jgi:hypothetical protein
MVTALKIINTILILFTVFMSVKHGWGAMSGKPEALAMFAEWEIGKTGIRIFGAVVLISGVLILFPKTFFWGNFLTSAGILCVLMFFIQQRDFKSVLIEIPFLILPWIILYLRHPLAKNSTEVINQ